MDLWKAFQDSAVIVLRDALDAAQFDRAQVERALHLYAIGVNRDPHVPMPPLNVLDDVQLRKMVEALLSGVSGPPQA